MKYTIVFFSTVGQCPWWVSDTDECGLQGDELRCTNKPCNIAPNALPPPHCPAREVPNSDNSEAVEQPLTAASMAIFSELSKRVSRLENYVDEQKSFHSVRG